MTTKRINLAQADRRFFTWMAISATVVVLAGFAPTFYLKSFTTAPTKSLLAYIHGTVFTSWMALFVVQTRLIATRRTSVHRKLGVYGSVLAAIMVVLGCVTSVAAARHGYVGTLPGGTTDPLEFLANTIGDMVVFSTLIAAALYFRRQPDTHKRLMLLATTGGLIIAAINRLPFVIKWPPAGLLILLAFLVSVPVYDRITRGRLQIGYQWGLLFVIASFPLRGAVGMTAAWHDFAARLVG